MKLYNTMSRKVEEFLPASKGKAVYYVCGITPYDYCHLGHARTLVAFDILRRWWEHKGMEIVHIQNVTDIDDKIIKRARELGEKPLELSSKFDKYSREDMQALGIKMPTHMPKISECIPQTIEIIQKIIDNGYAYVTESGVYFDISKFKGYGKLSGQKLESMQFGARVEVDEKKQNAGDFALWKLEETEGATYQSPWGRGRPGWHIECSAMSLHISGWKTLDAHCGARDLIFPHHENEIAQSEAAGVKPFSRFWLHTGFLTVNGEKMAKSLGNFMTIRDALKKWDAMSLRLFFALVHYRSPIDFSQKAIESSANALSNLKRSLAMMEGKAAIGSGRGDAEFSKSILGHVGKFEMHMDNDLDTPNALAEVFAAGKEIARAKAEGNVSRKALADAVEKVKAMLTVIGIDIGKFNISKATGVKEEEINMLIEQREMARKAKDWEKADEIRNKLKQMGIIVEDSDAGPVWRKA